MTSRKITTHGWTAKDNQRAEQMRTERGDLRGPVGTTFIFDEIDLTPWKAQRARWRVTGIDTQEDGSWTAHVVPPEGHP